MRIISGEFRRRILETPRDAETTRPIPDRVKESLFQLLRGHFEGVAVFDGFSGTGAIGLEAVSRGATRCVMVERDKTVAQMLKRNIAMLGCEDRCELVVGDVLGVGALARCPRPVHLVFLDPPYPLVRETLGFRRVMDQFSKLIDRLDDKGFAVLRTPWPLFVADAAEPEEAPEPEGESPEEKRARRFKKQVREEASPKRGSRRSEEDDDVEPSSGDREVGGRSEPVARAEVAEPAAETEAEATARKAVRADLTLANAQGPETHVYGSMAVHLYMRK